MDKAIAISALFLLASCASKETAYNGDLIAGIPTNDNPRCGIVRIVDGDTVTIRCSQKQQNARLVGFDTPETFRPRCAAEKSLGLKAKSYLRKTLENAETIVPDMHGVGKYKRLLVQLTVDGQDLADIMISANLAVPNHGEKRINWCERLNG